MSEVALPGTNMTDWNFNFQLMLRRRPARKSQANNYLYFVLASLTHPVSGSNWTFNFKKRGKTYFDADFVNKILIDHGSNPMQPEDHKKNHHSLLWDNLILMRKDNTSSAPPIDRDLMDTWLSSRIIHDTCTQGSFRTCLLPCVVTLLGKNESGEYKFSIRYSEATNGDVTNSYVTNKYPIVSLSEHVVRLKRCLQSKLERGGGTTIKARPRIGNMETVTKSRQNMSTGIDLESDPFVIPPTSIVPENNGRVKISERSTSLQRHQSRSKAIKITKTTNTPHGKIEETRIIKDEETVTVSHIHSLKDLQKVVDESFHNITSTRAAAVATTSLPSCLYDDPMMYLAQKKLWKHSWSVYNRPLGERICYLRRTIAYMHTVAKNVSKGRRLSFDRVPSFENCNPDFEFLQTPRASDASSLSNLVATVEVLVDAFTQKFVGPSNADGNEDFRAALDIVEEHTQNNSDVQDPDFSPESNVDAAGNIPNAWKYTFSWLTRVPFAVMKLARKHYDRDTCEQKDRAHGIHSDDKIMLTVEELIISRPSLKSLIVNMDTGVINVNKSGCHLPIIIMDLKLFIGAFRKHEKGLSQEDPSVSSLLWTYDKSCRGDPDCTEFLMFVLHRFYKQIVLGIIPTPLSSSELAGVVREQHKKIEVEWGTNKTWPQLVRRATNDIKSSGPKSRLSCEDTASLNMFVRLLCETKVGEVLTSAVATEITMRALNIRDSDTPERILDSLGHLTAPVGLLTLKTDEKVGYSLDLAAENFICPQEKFDALRVPTMPSKYDMEQYHADYEKTMAKWMDDRAAKQNNPDNVWTWAKGARGDECSTISRRVAMEAINRTGKNPPFPQSFIPAARPDLPIYGLMFSKYTRPYRPFQLNVTGAPGMRLMLPEHVRDWEDPCHLRKSSPLVLQGRRALQEIVISKTEDVNKPTNRGPMAKTGLSKLTPMIVNDPSFQNTGMLMKLNTELHIQELFVKSGVKSPEDLKASATRASQRMTRIEPLIHHLWVILCAGANRPDSALVRINSMEDLLRKTMEILNMLMDVTQGLRDRLKFLPCSSPEVKVQTTDLTQTFEKAMLSNRPPSALSSSQCNTYQQKFRSYLKEAQKLNISDPRGADAVAGLENDISYMIDIADSISTSQRFLSPQRDLISGEFKCANEQLQLLWADRDAILRMFPEAMNVSIPDSHIKSIKDLLKMVTNPSNPKDVTLEKVMKRIVGDTVRRPLIISPDSPMDMIDGSPDMTMKQLAFKSGLHQAINPSNKKSIARLENQEKAVLRLNYSSKPTMKIFHGTQNIPEPSKGVCWAIMGILRTPPTFGGWKHPLPVQNFGMTWLAILGQWIPLLENSGTVVSEYGPVKSWCPLITLGWSEDQISHHMQRVSATCICEGIDPRCLAVTGGPVGTAFVAAVFLHHDVMISTKDLYWKTAILKNVSKTLQDMESVTNTKSISIQEVCIPKEPTIEFPSCAIVDTQYFNVPSAFMKVIESKPIYSDVQALVKEVTYKPIMNAPEEGKIVEAIFSRVVSNKTGLEQRINPVVVAENVALMVRHLADQESASPMLYKAGSIEKCKSLVNTSPFCIGDTKTVIQAFPYSQPKTAAPQYELIWKGDGDLFFHGNKYFDPNNKAKKLTQRGFLPQDDPDLPPNQFQTDYVLHVPVVGQEHGKQIAAIDLKSLNHLERASLGCTLATASKYLEGIKQGCASGATSMKPTKIRAFGPHRYDTTVWILSMLETGFFNHERAPDRLPGHVGPPARNLARSIRQQIGCTDGKCTCKKTSWKEALSNIRLPTNHTFSGYATKRDALMLEDIVGSPVVEFFEIFRDVLTKISRETPLELFSSDQMINEVRKQLGMQPTNIPSSSKGKKMTAMQFMKNFASDESKGGANDQVKQLQTDMVDNVVKGCPKQKTTARVNREATNGTKLKFRKRRSKISKVMTPY